jgi:hypothetical protein
MRIAKEQRDRDGQQQQNERKRDETKPGGAGRGDGRKRDERKACGIDLHKNNLGAAARQRRDDDVPSLPGEVLLAGLPRGVARMAAQESLNAILQGQFAFFELNGFVLLLIGEVGQCRESVDVLIQFVMLRNKALKFVRAAKRRGLSVVV